MNSVQTDQKTELIQNIKEWIKLDAEIAKLKAEMKARDTKKKALTSSLVNIMKNNKIDCFDMTGGSLVYKQEKKKKPLTGKTLLTALNKYYKNEPEVAKELTKYVLDNREVEIKETVVMKSVDKDM
jgi:exopolysaccharide biosynthesis protein